MDLMQYSGPLLAVFGFAYQWVRQHAKISEAWTGVFAVIVACAVYALCYDFSSGEHPQVAAIKLLLWLSGAVPTVLGGTFTASKLASAGVSAIPMTNSKG